MRKKKYHQLYHYYCYYHFIASWLLFVNAIIIIIVVIVVYSCFKHIYLYIRLIYIYLSCRYPTWIKEYHIYLFILSLSYIKKGKLIMVSWRLFYFFRNFMIYILPLQLFTILSIKLLLLLIPTTKRIATTTMRLETKKNYKKEKKDVKLYNKQWHLALNKIRNN